MTIHIGITEKNLNKANDLLMNLLADYYVMMLKAQNYHWNVQSTHFKSYHELFEFQYNEISEAIDMLAERIRTLGFKVPANFRNILARISLKEETGEPDAESMIKNLADDHEHCARMIRDSIEALEDSKDEGTIDLLVEFLRNHEKAAWMIRNHLPYQKN